MNWQPIDTAPKDGTLILAYTKNYPYKEYSLIAWKKEDWAFEPTNRYRWCELAAYDNEYGRDEVIYPDYWMPLEPPKEK